MSSYKPFRDHTCYTMTTAGSQGFLNLLPIYLDHILYPTLTPEGKYNQISFSCFLNNSFGKKISKIAEKP